MTTSSNPQYEDEIDLLRYGRFLAAYWLLLLVGTMVGAFAGFAVALRAPVRYQATSTLAIAANSATALSLSPAASRALLANLSLVAETIEELQLNRDGVTPQAFIEDALNLQPVPTTNLLKVSVALPDPTKARLAAGTLAQKAVNLSRRLDQEGAVTGRDALKQQMDEAAQRLDSAQDRLLKFQSSAQIEVLEAQADSKLKRRDRLSNLAIDLEREKARLASMERELARQPPVVGVPRPGGVSPTRPNAQRDARAETEAPDLDTSNSFTNPVYGRLQYEVAESRARMASLEKERAASLGTTAGPGATKELSELYRRRMELSRLQADYDVSLRVYSDLATKYEEARSRVVGLMPQLQIVDAPVQPDRPLPRHLTQSAFLGGLIGLIGAAVAAVLLNRRGARSPG